MSDHQVFAAGTPVQRDSQTVEGGHVDIGGERFYRVASHDAMPPFFMSLVSDSDHWLFISSNGGLTAGRRDPDHALFPYYTDDRIHDSQDQSGSKTLLQVAREGKTFLWEPFSQRYAGLYRVERNLYKSVFGNKILFEEINHDLGLVFSCAWMNSERFGFVRRMSLANQGADSVSVELLDGIQNILPAEIIRRFQLEFSTLADGYKEAELEPATGLAIFRLSSVPTDKAEPSEALRATTVWSEGLDSAKRLLSAIQLDRFREGLSVEQESEIRGRRGAYFLNARVDLPPGGRKEWSIVAEVGRDAADIAALLQLLRAGKDLRAELDADVQRGTSNLVRIVAGADGLQLTADELSTWRHFSNTLFNVMRGGVPDQGYSISRDDLKLFLGKANREVLHRHAAFLDALPETVLHSQLLSEVRDRQDTDLERLAREYLPLTFSRRHGDPSRPWNIFAIEVKDEHGRKILNYQGNWRDIFQNWEALALSFPGYVESMIFKFVDASTADGYNPYRVTRNGFEWEVIEPLDPWANIGYWGDHQVIYLLKLLEISARHHPGAIANFLMRRLFTYANVPYRIKPYEALLEDPRSTIEFDAALDHEIQKRVAVVGEDAKLLRDASGQIWHANLAEKLLVLLLAKLSNYVPEAGIWMNTQRPEWNDANNALVGSGASMVTLYYMRRFLAFCADLFKAAGPETIAISYEVAEMFRQVSGVLERHLPLLKGPISDLDRKTVLDALGKAGSSYRAKLYAKSFSGNHTGITAEELRAFCDLALRHIDHSIRANRREDGLYHSYNLIKVLGSGIAIRRLYEMLEGQVAVLSSGVLSAAESAALLDALRNSRLYRADQSSYVLYPDRRLPRFLEKNNIPAKSVERSKLLAELLRRGDRRIVVRDASGVAHFNASFRNAMRLKEALQELKQGEYRDLVEKEEALILDLYEEVFDHQSFTGRSGTFYKYEGLGCIYWHMVSKLLLAVEEVVQAAERAKKKEDATVAGRLVSHYHEIREGIGAHKPPELYGAIPTDPYSHTPGFAGVQQPGMTGQVKEDFISRLGEMGVRVEGGCLAFRTSLLNRGEFLTGPKTFRFHSLDGKEQTLALEKDTLAFTLCQTPVVAHRAGRARIEVGSADGSRRTVEGLELDPRTSAAIFQRTGEILRLDVYFGLDG